MMFYKDVKNIMKISLAIVKKHSDYTDFKFKSILIINKQIILNIFYQSILLYKHSTSLHKLILKIL